MTVWLIIGGILLFLLLLLLLPVHLYAAFQGELLVRVRYLFIVKQLFPSKAKKPEKGKKDTSVKKAKDKKKEEKEQPSFGQMLREDGVSATLSYYKNLASLAATGVKKLLHVLVVDNLDVKLCIAAPDAAQTALEYGKVCAAVYPAQALLETVIKVKKRTVSIAPDFLREEGEAAFAVHLHVTPLRLIGAATGLVIQYLVHTVKDVKNNQDGGKVAAG